MQILNPSHHNYQPTKPWEELHQSLSERHPSGFCYQIKFLDDTLYSRQLVTFVKEFSGDGVAKIFMDTLKKNITDIYKKFKFPTNMTMTSHDELVYDNFTNCHICNEELGEDSAQSLSFVRYV